MSRWARMVVGLLLVLSSGAVVDATYERQPVEWLSYIECHDGWRLYDDELAALSYAFAADRVYGSLVFVFTQCYGGGMLDDLEAALEGTGDVVVMSASQHDEASWRAVSTDPRTCLHWSALWQPEGYFASVIARGLSSAAVDASSLFEVWKTARDTNPARPRGPATWPIVCPGDSLVHPPEHAQWLALGRGEALRLGVNANGETVAAEERHAVLFVGDGDAVADWNDLELIYAVVMAHGFTPERTIVLAGPGPGHAVVLGDPQGVEFRVPEFVDGPGTREALIEAFRDRSRIMGSEAQFVMWVGGHGGRVQAIPWSSAVPLAPASPLYSLITAEAQRLDDGSHYELFVFRGEAGQRITVIMRSDDLDAYLWLYDDARQLLAVDDDSGGGTDARLTFSVSHTGVFYVLANTYAAEETGSYVIELRVSRDKDRRN